MLFSPFRSNIIPQSPFPQMDNMPNPLNSHDAIIQSLVNTGNGVNNGGDPDPVISIKDSAGLKSGNYPTDKVKKLIAASKIIGVNPLDSLPIAIQENSFQLGAKPRARNRGSFGNVDNTLFDDKDNQTINDLVGKGYDEGALKLALALKKKMAYAKQLGLTDEASQLQAYNGLGVITPKQFGGATKAYGVDITNGVDLKKNPLYGKRVMQLRKDLQSNKDLLALLNSK